MTYRLLAACFALLLVSIAPLQAQTVRWGRSGDAATLDPHAAADSVTLQLVRNIYEPLVAREADGSIAGKLAASWLRSADDSNLWVFNLRRAVFHDGSPFDAEDVIFSIERARSEASALHEAASGILSARALDGRSVAIRFAEPTAILPAVLSDILVMDKQWAEANKVAEVKAPGEGDEPFSERHANGTGPYRLDSRDPDVRTKLVANERYHSQQPAAAEIIYLPIVNPAMQATALMRGEIDVLQDVDFADIERLEEADGIAVETGPANGVLYLGYPLDKSADEAGNDATSDAGDDAKDNPFANPKVRQAIELAVDRNEAARFTDRGHAEATAILAPPFVSGWSNGLAAQVTPDKARAKELLAEAGYPDGFAVRLDVANAYAPVANRIASMLASVGIWAEVVARTQQAHDAHVASGGSAFHLTVYSAPGYDSAGILKWLIEGIEGYDNAELAARIEALAGIGNKAERSREIAAIWRDVQKERIVLPLVQLKIAHAMNDAMTIPVDPNNQTRFETIRFD